MSDLVGNPEDRFSRVVADIVLSSTKETIKIFTVQSNIIFWGLSKALHSICNYVYV